ncbi:MAG TPA: hypothetical protein VKU89_10570 [Solirubrobacteraceae bacterium]|nr:hypothetical protein [Solirubrobacteraceae bacterium]
MITSSPFGVRGRRVLSAVAVAATFAALCVLPASALATTTTSASEVTNYSATPTVSTATTTEAAHTSTTTSTESKATHEVKPKKESETPAHEVKPKKESITPPSVSTTTTTTTPQATKSSLPFTGLNLAWLVGAGVLLLGIGASIRLAARRAH